MKYAGLHVHSHYSQFDGIGTPVGYAERAVEIGMDSLALTDHGTLSGHREWYREMKAVGVKPILGIEAYFTHNRFDTRDKAERTEPLDLVYNHLVILAKNDQGLENLNTMNRLAWTEGYYKKPRIDWELLDKYSDGLIVTSACMSGLINKAIEHDQLASAKIYIKQFIDRFGDNFYVEVMPHNPDGMNAELINLADSLGVKVVVTPDCHHVDPSQKVVQELALLMQTHANFRKEAVFADSLKYKDMMERIDYLYGDRMLSFRDFDIHLMSGDEMWAAMGDDARPDMFENTLSIADSIEEYNIPRNLNLLPVRYRKPDDKLRELAEAGLKERGLDSQECIDRLNEELKVIKNKRFAPYFLMVQNVVEQAKSQGIRVGPGRGSAAGSLVCYATGITDVDPIEYGLLFFRFIDPSRSDWPDIDLDFMDSRRDEVKEFLINQYGHVSAIATFLTFKDKGIVRDVSRVLAIPLSEVNVALKKVETWEEFMTSPNTAEFREKYPEVAEYGAQLRGLIRGSGTHAAGMVASKMPIAKVAPVETRSQPNKEKRQEVVALDMNEAADVGLVKMDFLGLKTLTVIDDCLTAIAKRHPFPVDWDAIPLDDKGVYDMLSAGHTMAVFQAEAVPYTNLLRKMGVNNFEELAASNALVRPGAMNSIGQEYIDRKNGRAVYNSVHPIYDEIGKDTFGLISLYQEQIMQAVVHLAGMTWEDANKIRKIIGKKGDPKLFDLYRDQFVTGAGKNVGEEFASKLWDDFVESANYQFNKSHAVAYSLLTYKTAWLKYHYPLEYMYAALKNEKDKDARTDYLLEAKRLGITVKLPHVNESGIDFTIEGDSLRFGLSSIKYVSDISAQRFIDARPFKNYEHLKEFVMTKGTGVNSRSLEFMDKIGAAAFPDHTIPYETIKSNLYEVLNLPEFTTDLPAHYYSKLTDLDDYVEGDMAVVFALARSIKRGKGWSRVEFVDRTGTGSAFDRQETDIESGKVYMALMSDNRIFTAIPAADVTDTKYGLVKYLNLREIPLDSGEYFVVALKARTTKAGKKMMDMVLANSDGELAKVVCFSKEFPSLYMKVKEGYAYKMILGTTKDGSIVYRGLA